ncbi:MAG: ATP-dependent DNA helicase [Gammaproteobacteria bacterium]|nr:ATP-dependent DNA helicase [Gammaproteobacteria bacterium]
MQETLKLGIRQLTEFCCRSGDLGFDGGPGVKAQEGLRTHQAIQKRYSNEARAEYRIQAEIDIDNYRVELGGRIDLVFEQEAPPRIEEIKTVYSFMNQFSETFDEPHWAQVKCYAACYAMQTDIEELSVSLNYVNLFNHQEHRQCQIYQSEELRSFLLAVLRQYIKWYQLIQTQRELTITSARRLEFPHTEFRNQQRAFAAHVYRNIQQQAQLLVEAPTGSGKTISTLFPSIKAIGEDLADQIIYLSAKTSGQNQAIETLQLMVEQGLQISYLVIQAKSKSCACNEENSVEINIEGKCLRTIGFFDRLDQARESLIKQRHLDPTAIRTTADQYQLCPFELSLQLLPWIDVVIADFNYVFDPLVQLSYFKTDGKRKVLLVDEIHNLVDRARSMYSATLKRSEIRQALKADNSPEVIKALKRVNRALDKHLRIQTNEEQVSDESPQQFAKTIRQFGDDIGVNLFNNKHVSALTLELSKSVFRYQCIHNLYHEHHKTLTNRPVDQRRIKLLCLNALEYLKSIYPLFNSVCGFSATLSPYHYFLQALGLDDKTRVLRLDSSFPEDRLSVNICSFADLRYRQRDDYIDLICDTINRCYQNRPGNYLVFFSSYYFMDKVYTRFLQRYNDVDTMLQAPSSDDDQRQAFLDQLFHRNNTLAFAIMGGIFAEGIDYRGQALIGAIVVGAGLPQANTEQQLIQQDFERLSLNGFDFAFRFPGLIRVQQSAGRVIRSESDRGVIILLDRRFAQSAYRQHYPPHWQPQHCQTLEQLDQSLSQFWKNQTD